MCRYNRRVESAVYAILHISAAVTLISFSPVILRAQGSQPSAQSLRDARRAEMESRQRALWNLEKEARRSPRRQEQRLAYLQIKEDFEQLQVMNYYLSDAVGADTAPDYGRVKKGAAEVKKRATQLRTNLSLPELGKGEKPKKGDEVLTAEGLKPAAADLNSLVKSFVENPVFQQPDVVDVEHSTKARRDLEGIIRLSEQIRRSAEALSKAAGKNF